MNAKELIRFAFGDAIKDTPAGPVLMGELVDPAPCSCDEALALRAELAKARARIPLATRCDNYATALDAWNAEITLRRETEVELAALRTELARTRFLSVVRGKLAEGWAKMFDRNRAELTLVKAELAEANNRWHSACDVGRRLERRNAELLGQIDELQADNSKRHERLVQTADKLRDERTAHAETRKSAETWEALCHEQEQLGVEADALVAKFQGLATAATTNMKAMEVSMSAAYTERNRLVAILARICKPTAGRRRTPIEGWNPEWTNCVFIDTSQGQMSWHYHDSDAHLFASLPPYEKPWDGHTTAEKYERLWRLTELTEAIP